MLSRQFISPEDKILFIDDIIANGDAARGLIKIIERSGAELVGLGVVVEKAFRLEPGRSKNKASDWSHS